jgi:hypothetical protein
LLFSDAAVDSQVLYFQLLTDVQSCRAAYRKLCGELHRDIGRMRRDVERLANSRLNQGEFAVSPRTLLLTIAFVYRIQVLLTHFNLWSTPSCLVVAFFAALCNVSNIIVDNLF